MPLGGNLKETNEKPTLPTRYSTNPTNHCGYSIDSGCFSTYTLHILLCCRFLCFPMTSKRSVSHETHYVSHVTCG